MAKKTLECSHGGVVCRAKIEGETEDEVLEKGLAHAREKHKVDLAQSTTLKGYLRSLIRDAG